MLACWAALWDTKVLHTEDMEYRALHRYPNKGVIRLTLRLRKPVVATCDHLNDLGHVPLIHSVQTCYENWGLNLGGLSTVLFAPLMESDISLSFRVAKWLSPGYSEPACESETRQTFPGRWAAQSWASCALYPPITYQVRFIFCNKTQSGVRNFVSMKSLHLDHKQTDLGSLCLDLGKWPASLVSINRALSSPFFVTRS